MFKAAVAASPRQLEVAAAVSVVVLRTSLAFSLLGLRTQGSRTSSLTALNVRA